MADITDGMSNTLMAVEVDDAKAVIWTKPDDLDFNAANPLAGLGNLWHSGFLAVFCDGSVRLLSTGIDPTIMQNLINRHDGNAIDSNTLDAPPRPLTHPTRRTVPAAPKNALPLKPE